MKPSHQDIQEPAIADFVRNLQELLEERDWTQRQLSEFSGIPENSISNYLKGKYAPQLDGLMRLSGAFGVGIGRLFATGKEDSIIRIQKVRPTPVEAIDSARQELLRWSRIPPHIQDMLDQIAARGDWLYTGEVLKKIAQDKTAHKKKK